MTPIPMRERLKFIAILLLILLVTALSYTALHEGGHALAGLAFGGRITDFNVNFFNLGAHVGLDGKFSQTQSAVINVAGAALPFLAWALLMLVLPKKDNANLQWIKIISTMGFVNSLLAWVILPFLYLAGKAPPSDDVTKFINNSGLPALAVGLGALAFYAAGWVLFAGRIGSLRTAFQFLRGDSQAAPLPTWKRILIPVILIVFFIGAVVVGVTLGGVGDPSRPPADYTQVAAISLSERDHQSETVASFHLNESGDASVWLRVEGLDTALIDVLLIPAEGEPFQLLHGEPFSTDVSSSQGQYRLPAGEHKIVLTCPKSRGVLKVYWRLP